MKRDDTDLQSSPTTTDGSSSTTIQDGAPTSIGATEVHAISSILKKNTKYSTNKGDHKMTYAEAVIAGKDRKCIDQSKKQNKISEKITITPRSSRKRVSFKLTSLRKRY